MKVEQTPSSSLNAYLSRNSHRGKQIPLQQINKSEGSQKITPILEEVQIDLNTKDFSRKNINSKHASIDNFSSGHDLPPVCE